MCFEEWEVVGISFDEGSVAAPPHYHVLNVLMLCDTTSLFNCLSLTLYSKHYFECFKYSF